MKKNRVLFVLLAIVAFSALFGISAFAASASGSISTNYSAYTVGSRISVNVRFKGSEPIGSWDYTVSYDPSVLEYISGADSGGGGLVRTVGFTDGTGGVESVNATLTFKALKIATTTVTATPIKIICMADNSYMQVTGATRTIKVVAVPTASSVNTLSSLLVSPGTLEPEFSADTTAYTMTVPFETAELIVSATPADGSATVAVSPAALAVGANTINVDVTAQNGNKRTYTITATRLQSDMANVHVTVNDIDFTFGYDAASLVAPEGFTQTIALFQEKGVLAYRSPKETVTIVYLVSEQHSGWFIYSEKSGTFTEFVRIDNVPQSISILPISEGMTPPAGFTGILLETEGGKILAYKFDGSEENGIYLVYAMTPDGNADYYFYDSKSNSFIRYFEGGSINAMDELIAAGFELTDGTTPMDLFRQMQAAEDKAFRSEIISISIGIAATLLLVVLVIVLIRRKPLSEEEVPMASSDEVVVIQEDTAPDVIRQDTQIEQAPDFTAEEQPPKK